MIFQKCKEIGWYVIPLVNGQKKPITSLEHLGGFTGISLNGISDEVLEEWDNKYKDLSKIGLAMVLGKSTDTCVIDIDSNDYEILKLIPETPLSKKGRLDRVGSFFYRHISDYHKSKELFGDREKDDSVEFLNSNCITVIPPSLHPKGMRYAWSGEVQKLTEISPKDLPILDLNTLELINDYYKKKYKDDYKVIFGDQNYKSDVLGVNEAHDPVMENGKLRCANGSHDRIKYVISKKINEGLSIEDIVREVLYYDKTHHLGVSYFEDKSRGKDASLDPTTNALTMVTSILRTINVSRKSKGENVVSLVPSVDAFAKEIKKPKEKKEELKLPPITGMMSLFVEYLNKSGKSENTEVNLGAAIIWLSALVASRYAVITRAHTTPCNLMVWGIMPSGVGKDAPQKLLQNLLYGHRILGANAYKSAPSLLQAFTNKMKPATKNKPAELLKKAQREILMVMDECSSLFRQATHGEGYQEDMPLVLNTLFSRSSDYYAGDSSIVRGDKYGQCWNPYVTTLGFTTVEHLKNVQGKNIVGNGFFERSLFFIKEKRGKYNNSPFKDDDLFKELKSFTDHCLNEPIELIDYGRTIEPEQEILTEVAYKAFPINGEAEDKLQAFDKEIFHSDQEEFDRSFANRFTELSTKLSLLHALSEQKSHISIENVNWAIDVVKWSYSKAKPYLKDMRENGEDVYKKAVEKISMAIKRHGGDSLPREELIKIRIEPKGKQRKAFIEELIGLGLIQESFIEGTKKREIKLPEI